MSRERVSPPATPNARLLAWKSMLGPDRFARQLEFFQVHVHHKKIDLLLELLMPLLIPHSESNILLVTGAPGVGKSTVTRVLLRKLLDRHSSELESDTSTVPFVAVEAHADGNTRHGFAPLYRDMRDQLQGPNASGMYFEMTDGVLRSIPQARETIASLRRAVEFGFRQRRTQVCVIDEAAHLLRFGRKAAVMDTLKSISNTSGVKWVLVGSYDLVDMLCESGQITRRTSILSLDRYDKSRREDLTEFARVVRLLMRKWPCPSPPALEAISAELFDASLGCVGLLKSALLEASALQLANDGKWRGDFLPRAVKSLGLLDVIRTEIEAGEKRVDKFLIGRSPWDDDVLQRLVHRVQPKDDTTGAAA